MVPGNQSSSLSYKDKFIDYISAKHEMKKEEVEGSGFY